MKICSIVVVALGTMATSYASAALVNPSFESSPGPGLSPFAGWTESGISGNIFQEPAPVLDGSFSAKMFSQFTSSDNFTFLFQDVAALAGQNWTSTISVQHTSGDALTGGNDARLKIEFLDAGLSGLAQSEIVILTAADPTDVWTQSSVSAIAPAGTAFARIALVFHGDVANSGGAAFFDVASLTLNTAPEPTTGALALLAAMGCLLRRPRRTSRAC